MANMVPRGRTTDAIALVTFVAFFLAFITHRIDQVALFAGFIPARVHALAAQGIDLGVPWLPVWLTPLTATLVHGSWLHVGLNLLILLFCGRQIEHLLGTTRCSFSMSWALMPPRWRNGCPRPIPCFPWSARAARSRP